MTIFSNNIPSSASNMHINNAYENLNYNNSMKSRNEVRYNSNVLHSANYITLSRTRQGGGCNTYLFWTLIILLFLLACGNLILTFVILGVLRLGQGMESLELVPEESLIKFFGDTDLDNIYKRDGKLEGFGETPVEIFGNEALVAISVVDAPANVRPIIELGLKGSGVKHVESFGVRDPVSGRSVFSTDFPNLGLPRGVKKLDVRMALTKRVSSPIDESFTVKSDSFIKLKGSEGVHIDGKEIVWSADRDIFLKSVNRSLVLNGRDGVFIDVKGIPLTSSIKEMSTRGQYKLCVCMPNGKLFGMAVKPHQSPEYGCHSVDITSEVNPCS